MNICLPRTHDSSPVRLKTIRPHSCQGRLGLRTGFFSTSFHLPCWLPWGIPLREILVTSFLLSPISIIRNRDVLIASAQKLSTEELNSRNRSLINNKISMLMFTQINKIRDKFLWARVLVLTWRHTCLTTRRHHFDRRWTHCLDSQTRVSISVIRHSILLNRNQNGTNVYRFPTNHPELRPGCSKDWYWHCQQAFQLPVPVAVSVRLWDWVWLAVAVMHVL